MNSYKDNVGWESMGMFSETRERRRWKFKNAKETTDDWIVAGKCDTQTSRNIAVRMDGDCVPILVEIPIANAT